MNQNSLTSPTPSTPGCPGCQLRGAGGTHTANCPFATLQHPASISPSTISSGSSLGGTITANNVYKTLEYTCVVCGDTWQPTGFFNSPSKPYLCGKCEMRFKNKIVELMVPADSKEHCPNCHYHVKACKCDEAEKMKQLEK